ncbi:MAG: hypothetical protein ABSC64_19830 [Candidatus Korobacteraceae bacterium]
MDVRALDAHLYKWISVANERAERYDFPPGLIEEHVEVLKSRLGPKFILEIFENTQPLHLLGLRGQVLDRWLRGGANVDDHVIQVIDLAAIFEEFKADPCLDDKIDRLKRNAFWPSQFELAMALRAKRAIGNLGSVRLSCETNTAIGDFMIDLDGCSIACECARLEFGEGEEEQFKLLGDLYQYLDHRLKRMTESSCIKIRLNGSLDPTSYTDVIRCLKKTFAHFSRKGEGSSERVGVAEVGIEPLVEGSERIPFRYVDGSVRDIRGSKWVSAWSFCRVNATSDDEAAAMYRAGIDFEQEEYARIFIAWQRNNADLDPYARIQSKIKKKKSQTKAAEGLLGRIIFLESQWDVDALDKDRLRQIIDKEMDNSRNTIAVVIGQRCANVHYRRWYKYCISKLGPTFVLDKALSDFFLRFYTYDRDFDPILNRKYRRTWAEAAKVVEEHEREREKQDKMREKDL